MGAALHVHPCQSSCTQAKRSRNPDARAPHARRTYLHLAVRRVLAAAVVLAHLHAALVGHQVGAHERRLHTSTVTTASESGL